jgi:hypothetical protein
MIATALRPQMLGRTPQPLRSLLIERAEVCAGKLFFSVRCHTLPGSYSLPTSGRSAFSENADPAKRVTITLPPRFQTPN